MANENIRAEVLTRLRNIKGHVAGIERMVEENQTCENILIQLSAIRSAIEKTGLYILENNVVECLCPDLETDPVQREKIERLVQQILAFLR